MKEDLARSAYYILCSHYGGQRKYWNQLTTEEKEGYIAKFKAAFEAIGPAPTPDGEPPVPPPKP